MRLTPFLFVVCSLFASLTLNASPADDAFFASIETAQLDINQFKTCDPSGKAEGATVEVPIDWKPNGLANYVQPPECSAKFLENEILNNATMAAKQNAISAFFQRCEARLKQFHNNNLVAEGMFKGTRYAYCEHPRVRSLKLKFEDGTTIGGVIGIQRPDKDGRDQPRPLVIYKCGVFCEVEDSSTKAIFMQMFDQAPFNLIAVGNNVSVDYAADNNHLAIGGYDDGMQLMRIAKLVRNSPLSRLTTSIHVIGMSLGGHAALMSSMINDQVRDENGRPYISSFIAKCPVVDLKKSVSTLFSDGMKGHVSREVLQRNVAKRMDESPVLQQFHGELSALDKTSQVPDLIAKYAADYYSRKPADWLLPPLDQYRITDVSSLWQRNDYFNYTRIPMHTPTLAFSAAVDWVVDPVPNSIKLDEILRSQKARTDLKTVIVPDGNHCAFSAVYGWDTISKLYESFVMAHSPEMRSRQRVVVQNFDTTEYLRGKLYENERFVRASLEFTARANMAVLLFEIWGSDGLFDFSCKSKSIYDGDNNCRRIIEVKVPISQLGAWAKVPETNGEAEQLTRWANMNLAYLTAAGRPIIDQKEWPMKLMWTEY